jgi:hypothetical protein
MQHHTPHTPRARVPIGALVALAIVALQIVGALGFVFWREWIGFAAAYPLVADALRFVLFAAPVSLAAGYGYTGLVILWRHYADHRYIQATHVERLTLAQRSQGLPTTVQSLSYHDSHKELPAPPYQLEAPEPVSAPPSTQALGSCLTKARSGQARR